jgi:hypothetical protein
VAKILTEERKGRLKAIEPTNYGRLKDTRGASLASSPSVGQSRSEKLPVLKRTENGSVMVPVLDLHGKALKPCHVRTARKLIQKGLVKRKWFKGIMVVQMLRETDYGIQPIAVGIDPGSKREGFTVKSKKHVYLNVLSDAVTWAKDRLEIRKNQRRHRRFKTPCRKNKLNKNGTKLIPSIKARYQIKLNVLKWFKKLYPIQEIVIEDIKAETRKGKINRRWNINFPPIEVAKNWFYTEVKKIGNLILKSGYDTFNHRNQLGLKKSSDKKKESFESHNVDSYCLADMVIPGKLDNKSIFRIIPMKFRRRQLHVLEPIKGNIRKSYGGTMSLGIKRGL